MPAQLQGRDDLSWRVAVFLATGAAAGRGICYALPLKHSGEEVVMALVTLRGIHLAFGGPPLLQGVNFSLDRGERVCLIGRNGEGKSTLLKLIAGQLNAEQGELELRQNVRIAYLEQEVPRDTVGSVFDLVAQGLGDLCGLVSRYHEATLNVGRDPSDYHLDQLSRTQHELEAVDGWRAEQRVEAVLSRLGLEADRPFATLSGGLKRRVLLGRALACEPDLLLLDEPTNHLDIESIDWLEAFLIGFSGALLFVTHDRRLLERLATRILELDRGQITDWPGDYANYLQRREERLHAEAKAHDRFDKKLAQEEVWIRQGIKARRTRNEGRVRALEQMRREFQGRRNLGGAAQMQLQESERSGRLVVEAKHLHYAWEDRPIIRDFSTLILRGDKIGILGPNGCGKTTLLNLLLGHLTPDSGTVHHGTRLSVAYFDQQRAQLDEEATVQDNVGEGSDQVTVNGKSKHVLSYLQDFLFAPARARQPVKALSGGERNRLLLARLFTRPANLLVLDEPTNDLDIETLELLEDLLLEFQGTLLVVSHDRAFLDNLVTSTFAFEGDGRFGEYVGGYQDWLRQRRPLESAIPPRGATRPAAVPASVAPEGKRLSFKEQRELAALPKRIEELEAEQAALQAQMADAAFYRQGADARSEVHRRLEQIEVELRVAYARWEALEGK
jgi:ABC transport system ATP-binding/permease protein